MQGAYMDTTIFSLVTVQCRSWMEHSLHPAALATCETVSDLMETIHIPTHFELHLGNSRFHVVNSPIIDGWKA